MVLVAPFWLMLLLPWGGLVACMLLGRPQRAEATAVFLWSSSAPERQSTRALRRPALWVVVVLAALLMAIAALSQPARLGPARVKIEADDRPGLAATVADGVTRMDRTLAEVTEWARQRGVQVVTDEPAVRVRITDASNERDTQDLVPVLPREAVANAGVSRVAYTNGQVMLSIANRRPTPIESVTLRRPDAAERVVMIDPIAPGNSADRFVAIEGMPAWIEFTLNGNDGYAPDDTARLAQAAGGATLVVGAGLPASVGRIARAYERARGVGSRPVLLTRDTSFTGDAVVLGSVAPADLIEPKVSPHTITEGVDWPRRMATPTSAPPGDAWIVVASANMQPILAVRETPARQVWMALDEATLAQSVEFAVLWTNAIDFVSRETVHAMTSGTATANQRVGLVAIDGVMRAVNQPYVDTSIIRSDESWRDRLQLRIEASRERRSSSTPLYLAASLLAALGTGIALFRR
jgi:hypothetical protein